MHTWPVQDAKARFSEFLDRCLTDGPQIVTKRGTQTAVLIPLDEWHRLQAAARPSLKDLLLAKEARASVLVVPPRSKAKRRSLPELR